MPTPTRIVPPTTHGFNGVALNIGLDATPAEAWLRLVYHDKAPEAKQRRVHVGEMTLDEAQELLLLIAHVVPAVFDQAVAVDRRSR
jgi:hypothetical protein